MKTKFRLNAIFIVLLSFVLIAQQSIGQRTGRSRAPFRGHPIVVKPFAPSFNRYGYQPRFMPYGRRTRLPYGLTFGLLPRGYWRFNFGGLPYYYYSGVFYRSTNNHQYQVIEAPIGAEVPNLPNDAKPIIINEQKLYEYLGTYYKEVMDENILKYKVVGM